MYVGIDIGSSRTKVALIDADGTLVGRAVRKSGTDFAHSARLCLEEALQMAGAEATAIAGAVSTGYGRENVGFLTSNHKTEIGCLAKAAYHYFPQAMTVIDIGGQDNKVVKIGAAGERASFKMNRKCAAGTGAFLEEMSSRLDVSLGRMNEIAREATEMVKLGSYCTVFSATEVLEHIRQGKRVPDIVRGVFHSVIKRVLEMDLLTERVFMSGGVVAHNPVLVEMTEALIGRPVVLSEHPQFVSAVGAALYARGQAGQQESSD